MKHSSIDRPYNVFLLFIIVAGAVLRFWNFSEIPFTFDELSAMSRTQFDSFQDLIRIGVVEKDSHPAGIQVFLYYWSMLFGEREYVIKLPFILAGIASIYLSYRIGEIWFGKTDGILTAAYLSSLQIFVMYSQIARPYASGLFFTLCAVLFWSKYFFKFPKLKYLVGFVFFSALSSYNHYFSLLFVAILGISGLFLIKKKNLLAYLLSGILIFILYIPHLSIIFAQAEKGSIGGWLGEPGPFFLLEFGYWLFHHSYIALIVFLLVIIKGVIFIKKSDQSDLLNMKRWLLVLWLIPAPVFGYIYSYTREPILQYSLLIFIAPYLFMLLFSLVGKWKIKLLSIAVGIILLVNILSLVLTKQHYEVFYRQAVNQLAKNAIELDYKNENDVFIINDYIPYYTNYFFRKYKKEIPFYTIRNKDVKISDFKRLLSDIEQNTIITSGLDDIYFQLILDQFPYWEGFESGFTYEQYIFSNEKSEEIEIPERKLIAQVTFNTNEESLWQYNENNTILDTATRNYLYNVKPDEIYGPKLEVLLNLLIEDIYQIIDVEVELLTNDTNINSVIVGEIKKDAELVHWQGSDFSDFGIIPGKSLKVFLTMDIQKAMSDKNNIDKELLRFYIWNRGQQQFFIKQIKVFLRNGNPLRYSL